MTSAALRGHFVPSIGGAPGFNPVSMIDAFLLFIVSVTFAAFYQC